MKKNDIIQRLINTLLLNDFDFDDYDLLRGTIILTLINEGLITIDDEVYLDFIVKFDNNDPNHIILKSNNLITALWFNGIFPKKNLKEIEINNSYKLDNRVYFFNYETKKLGYKQLIKENNE